MVNTELQLGQPFRGELKPLVGCKGAFASVYATEVGTVVKRYERIYDHATGKKVVGYSHEQFLDNVVEVARKLQEPNLGLSPFLPGFVPFWQEEIEGSRGVVVSNQVIGTELHFGWPTNDDIARQLDDLISACLLVPLRVDHPDEDHVIMPDIFYYRDINSPVEVRMRNIIVGRLASASAETPLQVYLVDLHPAYIRREDYTPKKQETLIKEGIHNLLLSGYDYPKSRASATVQLEFMQQHWR